MYGTDAIASRIDIVNSAEHTLDLQYYIWRDDLTGLILFNAVKHAADRGVRVRILLDNLNEAKLQPDFKIFASHPSIEIRLINPDINFLNHRMHNKSLISDNQVAIVGGRNIGDEYFGVSEEINFTDFDVMLLGPVVNEVSQEFDLYWNSERSFPIENVVKDAIAEADLKKFRERIDKARKQLKGASFVNELNDLELDLHTYWGEARAVYDHPSKLKGKKATKLTSLLQSELKDVKKELILISPYFIPGKEGAKNLEKLRKKGIRVIILTNSLASNDVSSVFGGYRKYRKRLLKSGIELYELRPDHSPIRRKGHSHASSTMGLHGKVFIVDREKVVVGSMNLDARSRNLNTEMGVILQNEKFAKESANNLLGALHSLAYKLDLRDGKIEWLEFKQTKTKTYYQDPKTSWWKRSKTWFFSLFIPEQLL